jgi:hypothetical protein
MRPGQTQRVEVTMTGGVSSRRAMVPAAQAPARVLPRASGPAAAFVRMQPG